MPRHVRNFWLEGRVDGQSTALAGGPRSKEGGFTLKVKMRDTGTIFTALTVTGDYDPAADGLVLRICDAAGNDLDVVRTSR